jgi:CBS-domain-containing membrane protein
MFKAKDIMTTHVVAVGLDDTIDYAISLMVKHRISGLPVLDEQGCPVGIVSEFDLLELICEGHTEEAKVRHYMSPGLYGVAETDSWVVVADMFRSKHVRRLPVLRDGKLVGIVTRHDLVHAIRDARQQVRRKLSRRVCQTAGQTGTQDAPAVAPAGDYTGERVLKCSPFPPGEGTHVG